jgi:signal transduction histidine kinase
MLSTGNRTRGASPHRKLTVARPSPVIAAALVLTMLVLAVPPMHFAYPFPGAAIFVACLSSTSALAIALLFFGRHERSRRVDDLLLALTFGLTAILEAVLPLAAALRPWMSTVALWSRFESRGVAAIVVCLAAWLPQWRLRTAVSFRSLSGGVLAGSALIVGSTIARLSGLPAAVYGLAPQAEVLDHSPSVLAFRLVCCILLLAGAFGFNRRARRTGDEVMRYLTTAAALLGIARFHDFMFPSLRSDWLTTGDMLRVGAQIVLLVGALRAIDHVWQRRAGEAAAAERFRIASDLHDGLAQELAFLSAASQLAVRQQPTEQRLNELAESADRALSEARLAIAEISRTGDVRLDRVLTDIAGDIATRHHRQIELEVDEIVVDSHTAYELARVGKEAMTNAVRHAAAERIVVRLHFEGGQIELSVTDDGLGVTPVDADEWRAGFGMTSMRERVRRLNGRFTLTPGPTQRGTIVRVAIPRARAVHA